MSFSLLPELRWNLKSDRWSAFFFIDEQKFIIYILSMLTFGEVD